ncbi:MAG: NAD-dependent deacetylase [Elusimicrobia bacterium]|nr:MAG: NAD-dependent deacetylase [Elusimicrobiota bacterium]
METVESLLHKASRPLFFTGAGMSTGSGIPDFRGPQGVWKKRQPVLYQDFLASEEAREEHWDYKLEGFEQFRNAKPNDAHRALKELEDMGKVYKLVTQNIDGLHQDAGHESVIELHGTNREIECTSCGKRTPPEPAFEEFSRTRKCPICECGGYLKTATISFGQAMPEDLVENAFAAAAEADLAISIGSTLEVQPACLVPLQVLKNGAPYVVINRGATAHDGIATLRLEGDVNEILPAVVARLKLLSA